MKKLLLILLLPVFAQSQTLEFKRYFTIEPQVVEVDSTSADIIYSRLKNWVITTYNDPRKVIVVDTPKQIRIRPIAECFMARKMLGVVNCYDFYYQITLDIKDNKYRFTFDLEKVSAGGSDLTSTTNNWIWKKKNGSLRTNFEAKQLRSSSNISLNKYFNSIKTAALNDNSNNDNW